MELGEFRNFRDPAKRLQLGRRRVVEVNLRVGNAAIGDEALDGGAAMRAGREREDDGTTSPTSSVSRGALPPTTKQVAPRENQNRGHGATMTRRDRVITRWTDPGMSGVLAPRRRRVAQYAPRRFSRNTRATVREDHPRVGRNRARQHVLDIARDPERVHRDRRPDTCHKPVSPGRTVCTNVRYGP